MSAYANPLTSGSWNPDTSSPLSQPLFNVPQPPTGAWMNPGGYDNPKGGKETSRNVMLTNIISGQMKNMLAPQFAQAMSSYAGPAGDFFRKLMDLGSPYYQQKQSEGFTQGVQQKQSAAAQARQKLQATGYGYTPSGATAATIGGMEMEGAKSMAEQFLQNLFQNENLQAGAAGNLAQLAQLFNPTQLLGGISAGAEPVISPTTPQSLQSVLQGVGSLFGSSGIRGK